MERVRRPAGVHRPPRRRERLGGDQAPIQPRQLVLLRRGQEDIGPDVLKGNEVIERPGPRRPRWPDRGFGAEGQLLMPSGFSWRR